LIKSPIFTNTRFPSWNPGVFLCVHWAQGRSGKIFKNPSFVRAPTKKAGNPRWRISGILKIGQTALKRSATDQDL
jgi:hypothetical protein